MPAETWSFPAVPEQVGATRRAVAQYASDHAVPEPPLEDLKLALTEAVTNAVLHAFRDRAPGTITVAVNITPANRVTVIVADDGDGLTPRIDSPGLGVGMALIGALANNMDIRTPPTGYGTEVCMEFAIGEPAQRHGAETA